MGNKQMKDVWVVEVESVLKHYRRADNLAKHAARHWPSVLEMSRQGVNVATAIRRVLVDGLDTLRLNDSEGAILLWDRYIRGKSIEVMASEKSHDPSYLHRQRLKMIEELAVILHDVNRMAQRKIRFQRFMVRHEVFGFEKVVEELAALLRDPLAPTILVIEGMGGLGKTTLAKLIARCFVVDDFFLKVLWISAKQVDFDVWGGKQRATQSVPVKQPDLLIQLAKELDVETDANLDTLHAEVVARCKREPYLIILDNLETFADMVALTSLVDMLAGNSRILITTRDKAFDALPATTNRFCFSLNELDAHTSYQLLRSAAQYTHTPALAQASDDELAKIYDVVGGNPLALWLVAGQAQGIPWAIFLQDLVAYCPRGSKGYALYDYLYRRSWDQLSDKAKTVLFAMHRCEMGAEYALLQQLSQLDRVEFNLAVEELENRMLLQFDGIHYFIHRLTYTFLRVVIAGWWE